MTATGIEHGGDRVAEVLQAHGVRQLFTLCGGHISPILVAAKRRGIRVVDVRDEATAVFAADAVSRLTDVPGVAVVTAGPGVTNTITALKNAQLARMPLVLLGGATATVLKGRGSLQDIDQMALVEPHVKWAATVRHVRRLEATLRRAFATARDGVPGPVFVELPIDLLYPEGLVREWYQAKPSGRAAGVTATAVRWYLRRHVDRVFAGVGARGNDLDPAPYVVPTAEPHVLDRVAERIGAARRPVLLVGSQAVLPPRDVDRLQAAVAALGIPTYLSGMARGLLGRAHALHVRHRRKQALREADLVVLAGVPFDFRLDYGRHVPGATPVIAINRDPVDLTRNRRPDAAVLGDPAVVLGELARRDAGGASPPWTAWIGQLRERDEQRDREIAEMAEVETEFVNPIHLAREIEAVLPDEAVLVADGGDFVATASYVVRPRGPLTWLDPGVFGTLGVGAGFALGAKLVDPTREVWVLFGDGSVGYGLSELDTMVRHGLPVIAVVGNDGAWAQIARDQVAILGDDVATTLDRVDYHRVAAGFGAEGILVEEPGEVPAALARARELAAAGRPVLINVWIGKTDFREGSISM